MASSIPKPRASMTVTQGLSPVMKVPLNSRVVLSRRRTGTVKYVGKLVNESGEWYGVALDEPKGDSDGMRGKDRYFHCPANHGVFVRRKEINYVKEPGTFSKGPPSPVTDDSSSSSSSNVSTDQQEVNLTNVHPVPTSTESPTSPLMTTFKGFRKQLDFISLKTTGPGRTRESSPLASPVSSSPSSPTAKSGLKPPSPFRRFSSFSQGLPIPGGPGSPTNKTASASPEYRRRPSGISLSPKPSPVRRINSFRVPSSEDNENSIRPVETTSPSSPDHFSSFQYSPSNHFPVTEEPTDASTMAENEVLPPQLHVASPEMEILPITDIMEHRPVATPIIDDEHNDVQVLRAESVQVSPSHLDSVFPDESIASAEFINAMPTSDLAQEQTTQSDSFLKRVMAAFHIPPIDVSAVADASTTSDSPASSPRQEPEHSSSIRDTDTSDEDGQALSSDRTCSFRLARSSSFRVPSIDVQSSPSSSPESSPPRPNRNSTLNDSKGSPTSITVPGPRDGISKTSTGSDSKQRVGSKSPRSPRGRQDLTTVESLSPDKKLVEREAGSGERPLFFRRMNVGRSPIERRSSCSSFSTSSPSPPKLSISSNTASAAFRSTRVEELEREISIMRSSHENIVAVLRATNKQHAANVLELRAQVAALTEGNLLLERQLTAKGELVRELREMEKQHQRDTVSVSEVQKILEIKDTQIQTLEREMGQLRQRLARLESDKDSQLYKQFQHYESRRERDEKRINDLRKEVLAMCNERLELQSEVRDLKEMSLRFF
ncbi:hypothetical protein F443_05480 [Phytophthora nicotianae P1569]|uniref:CAP-Gly domain-containing protein n=1 Tax=Phytophthora nicotianae P1569 TaxID=1317065 RepID=V9FHZ9_PHYNI|nr:hypothetical protein F443_05480 [Phytophthora nicotianae P1569]